MKDVTESNFGLIIAFGLPGFVLLWSLSFSSPEVASLFSRFNAASENLGSFLFVTLASLSLGMFISAIRWAVIDHLIYITGLHRPKFDFSKLEEDGKRNAFQTVVVNHYRYYQFYSNTLVAVICGFGYFIYQAKKPSCALVIATTSVVAILFFASRDALKSYVERGGQILH